MPVVIRTREYGSAQAYREFLTTGKAESAEAEKDIEELWG